MKSSLKAFFAVALIAQMFAVTSVSVMTADDLSHMIACKDCK